jgi:hypothetical protein
MKFARRMTLIIVINIVLIVGFYLSSGIIANANLLIVVGILAAIIAISQLFFSLVRKSQPLVTISETEDKSHLISSKAAIVFFVLAFGLFIYLTYRSAILPNRYFIIIGAFVINFANNIQLWNIFDSTGKSAENQ